MVAETEKIELEALALNHFVAGNVGDDDMSEIGLTGLWAECGEFRAVKSDYILILRMFILKRLQNVRCVICGISHPLAA